MNSSVKDSRKLLRKQMRDKRRLLGKQAQRQASQQLERLIRHHPVFLRSRRISFYMAEDGEMDVYALIRVAERMGKQCFLPILHPLRHNKLLFGRYRQGDELLRNYFDLAEPPAEKLTVAPWSLDLVLMPLVGFDRTGNRLGMGGGFYDRTFGFRRRLDTGIGGSRPKCPVLMGIAHHFQEVQGLTREAWDVPLDYIATDREIIVP